MTDIEIWRDIKDYEGLYQVSNWGRFKNLNYRNTGKERLKNPSKDVGGYLVINLRKNNETKTCYVHRLVAETFLPNPEGKPCINHKIEGKKGKTMNFVFFNEDGSVDEERTTLEWATYEENNNYGTRTERAAKARSKPVLQLSLSGELIREWPSTRECGRNGFNQSAVAACCRGERKQYKGFLWMYK